MQHVFDTAGNRSAVENHVALAIANHCGPNADGAYMSVATLMRETNLSESAVRRAVKKLRDRGDIVPYGKHPRHQTVMYRIPLDRCPTATPVPQPPSPERRLPLADRQTRGGSQTPKPLRTVSNRQGNIAAEYDSGLVVAQ